MVDKKTEAKRPDLEAPEAERNDSPKVNLSLTADILPRWLVAKAKFEERLAGAELKDTIFAKMVVNAGLKAIIEAK